MAIPEPEFTVGIEEEYLLVDKTTRDLCTNPPGTMVQECAACVVDRSPPNSFDPRSRSVPGHAVLSLRLVQTWVR